MKSKIFRIILILVVLGVNLGLDQGSKLIARANLEHGKRVEVIGDFFIMQLADNPGAFLGLGGTMSDELRFVFLKLLPLIVMVGILVGLVFYYGLHKRIGTGLAIALASIMGGGFGNLIDRFFTDSKDMDFLNFGIGSLRTGILNVADLSITFGAIAAIILFSRMTPKTAGSDKTGKPDAGSKTPDPKA